MTSETPEGEDLGSMLDEELIQAARAGTAGATDELFRRHWPSGVGLARSLVGPSDAEDLTSEAFVRIFGLIGRGKGPDHAFRPYLMRTLRNLHVDRVRRGKDILTDELGLESLGLATGDGAQERAEASVVARAFAKLPERWQLALWHTEVEQESLTEVGQRLGMNANSAAALSFRAREGLRRAYLAEHVSQSDDPDCRTVLDLLPRLARGDLTAHQRELVRNHLPTCASCTAAAEELEQINTSLGALLLPAVAGTTLLAYRHGGATSRTAAAARGKGLLAVVGLAVVAGLLTLWLTKDQTDLAPSAKPTVPTSNTAATPASATPRATSTTAPVKEPASTPTPTPPAPTPTAPPVNVGLGRITTEVLSRNPVPWTHATVPVTGSTGRLAMVVDLSNVAESTVHRDGAFGAWDCTTVSARRLTCTLSAGRDGAPRDLGLDVTPAGPGPMTIAAAVSLRSAQDDDSADDRTSIRIPAAR